MTLTPTTWKSVTLRKLQANHKNMSLLKDLKDIEEKMPQAMERVRALYDYIVAKNKASYEQGYSDGYESAYEEGAPDTDDEAVTPA